MKQEITGDQIHDRKGRVKISTELLKHMDADSMRLIFSEFFPVRIDQISYPAPVMEYWFLSPRFEIIEEVIEWPFYEIQFASKGDEVFISHVFKL